MTHQFLYNFITSNGRRASISLHLHELTEEEVIRLRRNTFRELKFLLKGIAESHLQHVTGPTEVKE